MQASAALFGREPATWPSEVSIRSGPKERRGRMSEGDEAVARLIIAGPMLQRGEQEGRGHWAIAVRIGSGSEDVHDIGSP
jgi:hypothetical protein